MVRIMNRSGHWAESRGKVNLYIIRTTQSIQYILQSVRPDISTLRNKSAQETLLIYSAAGRFAKKLPRWNVEGRGIYFLWILASSPHRLCAGTNSKKCFYPLSLSRRAHHLKTQMGLDSIRLSTFDATRLCLGDDWLRDVKFKTSEMTEFWLLSAFIAGLLTSNL